jgi:hypothetical protein
MTDAVLNRLLNLKVAKDQKGMAPNKPLLVLAIPDLVEAGLVGADGLVHQNAKLNLRFKFYYTPYSIWVLNYLYYQGC